MKQTSHGVGPLSSSHCSPTLVGWRGNYISQWPSGPSSLSPRQRGPPTWWSSWGCRTCPSWAGSAVSPAQHWHCWAAMNGRHSALTSTAASHWPPASSITRSGWRGCWGWCEMFGGCWTWAGAAMSRAEAGKQGWDPPVAAPVITNANWQHWTHHLL